MVQDAALANLAEAGDQRDGGQRVEHGVDHRQPAQVRSGHVGGRMEIDQPADQRAGRGRDADDPSDDAGRGPEIGGLGWAGIGFILS